MGETQAAELDPERYLADPARELARCAVVGLTAPDRVWVRVPLRGDR